MKPVASIANYLLSHAESRPDAIALRCPDNGDVTRTYSGLAESAAAMFDSLVHQNGIHEGDRVAVLGPDHWSTLPLLVAAASAECCLVPVNPSLHPDEFARVLKHARPRLIVGPSDVIDSVAGDIPRGVQKRSGVVSVEELLNGNPSTNLVRSAEPSTQPLLMIHTSGSTGNPRAVALSESNLAVNSSGIAQTYAIGIHDTILCTMPRYHINALLVTGVAPLIGGAETIWRPPFNFSVAKSYFEVCHSCGVTVLSLTPAIAAILLRTFPDAPDCPDLRLAVCGAAPLSEDIWKRFEKRFQIPLHQGYGLTETTCWATMTVPGQDHNHQTVGVPVNCELRIDASEQPGRGEIQIRGPIVMRGYSEEDKRWTSQDWFPTGDIGEMTETGQYKVVGRIKDLIIRSGVNIFPADIDTVLATHSAVSDCATVGVPDELRGEMVHTAITLNSAVDAPPSHGEFIEWLSVRLSEHRLPDRTSLVGEIPRNRTGKIRRPLLRDMLSGELARRTVSSISTRKFARVLFGDDRRVISCVQKAVLAGRPIPFVKYWGCGNRSEANQRDRDAFDRLKDFLGAASQAYENGVECRLLLTDTHAEWNQKPEKAASSYLSEIERMGRDSGFEVQRMSQLWKKRGLDWDQIDSVKRSSAFRQWWESFGACDELIRQAELHCTTRESEESAVGYAACSREEAILVKEMFPDSLFLTYNRPSQGDLLPNLPTIFLYSFARKTSAKPWFTEDQLD